MIVFALFTYFKPSKLQCKSTKYKSTKIKKISLDEKMMSKRAHGMLEIMKIYFPTNFQAYLMNIGQIITKKSNYDNMQMSF